MLQSFIYALSHYAECVRLIVITLKFITLSVIILNVVRLNVMAPRILPLIEVKKKKFYKSHTWAQCYKTFYDRNLRISFQL